MKDFAKKNWFKLGILFVLLLTVSVFVFYITPQRTPAATSSTAVAVGEKYAPEIAQFINALPEGDVSTSKCKELVSDKQTQLDQSTYSAEAHGPWTSLVDSRYIYSKKLCLAYISHHSGGTYPGSSTYQILDLGSNETFAMYFEQGPVNADGSVDDESLFLWGKEQGKPFLDISGLWFALTKQF